MARSASGWPASLAIVGGGMIVYFPLVWVLGGTDREELKMLLRRAGGRTTDAG